LIVFVVAATMFFEAQSMGVDERGQGGKHG
jgi:hypothetical protein